VTDVDPIELLAQRNPVSAIVREDLAVRVEELRPELPSIVPTRWRVEARSGAWRSWRGVLLPRRGGRRRRDCCSRLRSALARRSDDLGPGGSSGFDSG
jgi:hypothetical protein